MFLVMVMVVINSKNKRLKLIKVGQVNTDRLALSNRILNMLLLKRIPLKF